MAPFRAIAICLAIFGVFWSLFCILFLLLNPLKWLLMLGPGYLVIVGYIWRAATTPKTEKRRLIWGFSAIVQGAWLWWFITTSVIYGFNFGSSSSLEIVTLLWWVITFAVSILGIVADRAYQPPNPRLQLTVDARDLR